AHRCCIIRELKASPYEILFSIVPNLTGKEKSLRQDLDTQKLQDKIRKRNLEIEKNAEEGNTTAVLEPGTKVLLDGFRNKIKKKKLTKKWLGPFVVVSAGKSGQYIIKDGFDETLVANRRHLLEYKGKEPISSFQAEGDVMQAIANA
ncbi:MAG: uncharacterized protein A8A55_3538, partial [Amphiamblys sp. WSBS2006]